MRTLSDAAALPRASLAEAWPGRVSAVLLMVPPLALAVLGWQHRWMSEDAFIVLRVVRNLLAGHGRVFNVGERVEIYTSPLWVGLLALAGRLAPTVRPEWIAVAGGVAWSGVGLLSAGRGALLLAAP